MTSITNTVATRIGSHAHRYLSEASRAGVVISTFHNGLNVLFEKESDSAFVAIQTTHVPLHPWAIEAEAVGRVRIDHLAVAKSDGIRFSPCDVSFDLSKAWICELTIAPLSDNEAKLVQERMPLIEAALQAEQGNRPPDPFQSQIDAILERWRETDDPAQLGHLLGLGGGSTPSGDDVLVGLLAGLTAFEAVSRKAAEHVSRLRRALRTDTRQRTTQPSRQMIDAACDNGFPESVLRLVQTLALTESCRNQIESATAKVLALGALSGAAIVSGLLAASARLDQPLVHDKHLPSATLGCSWIRRQKPHRQRANSPSEEL